jgi:SDR family mycofactocin-dependent oxidoreductase
MGWLDGKVALVSGAARGQGRSHAVRLAQEGADIIGFDICRDVETMVYPGATPEDLDETVRLVEKQGRRMIASQADVRDPDAVRALVADGLAQLGRLDIVCANAGVLTAVPAVDMTDQDWAVTIDTDLTGVWNTISAALPRMIEQGDGGSVVVTSSTAGLRGLANLSHYSAAKHGVIGLARALAWEMGQHNIRINVVVPTTMLTHMVDNPGMIANLAPEHQTPTLADAQPTLAALSMLPAWHIEAIDISNAIAWLCSDQARYITAATIPVDLGATQIS